MTSAPRLLHEAIQTIASRGQQRDQPSGERSMDRIVAAFNAATGHTLTEKEGWLFMIQLKAVRSLQGQHDDDHYIDGAAYFALMGETE